MSTDLLREAAKLMRDRAHLSLQDGSEARDLWMASPAIDPDNNGWVIHQRQQPDVDWDTTVARLEYDFTGSTAKHIASWHPAVALAVADWLESEALAVEGHAAVVATHTQMDDCGCAYKDCFECGMWCRCSHVTPKPRSASAVARAYLGAAA